MHASYHSQVTNQALKSFLSPHAIETVITANLRQDGLKGLFGHPEYHFDDSQFKRGLAYVEVQRDIVISTVKSIGKAGQRMHSRARYHPCAPAWDAFGRLTHAVQDFYAHSNYITLWVKNMGPDKQRFYIPIRSTPSTSLS